jgi:hypothetical protein
MKKRREGECKNVNWIRRSLCFHIIIINNSIPFFIYLRAELNSQWPITDSARMRTTVIRKHRTKIKTRKQRKMDPLRLFKLKHDLLKNICRFTNCICSRNTSFWTVAEGGDG